ncbi:MAG: ATP synthase F1 subunit gamma [bacterium]
MANLRDIRKRIEASINIKKITKTMEKISSVRMIQAMKRLDNYRGYGNALFQYCSDLYITAVNTEKDFHGICMLKGREKVRSVSLIVITANQGMCGGFNNAVTQLAEKEFKKHKEAQRSVMIYALGKKGYQYFKRKDFPVEKMESNYSDKVTINDVTSITMQIQKDFKNEKVDEAYLLYTKYFSTSNRAPVSEILLPCKKYLKNLNIDTRKVCLCSPTIQELSELAGPELLSNRILRGLLESILCEHISRRFAMQQASTTAKDMIDELRGIYNTVRKSKITSELNEIMGTVMALGRR